MTNEDRRLHNCELAVVALMALISEDLKPDTEAAVMRFSEHFFNRANELGSKIGLDLK